MQLDSLPYASAPGFGRLFVDFCASASGVRRFYASLPLANDWQRRPTVPAHWPELTALLAEQNPASAETITALQNGAGVMITGQQVGILGGPLYSPLKAATVVARAREATSADSPHAAVFWMATEDHDFDEIAHVALPGRRELRKLVYRATPAQAVPVGRLALDRSILPLLDEARELLGAGEALEALEAAYQPGRTLGEAFASFYQRAFAAQGLLTFDPSGREAHRIGAPILRGAIERADELHGALLERNAELLSAGYHAQVVVGEGTSLLFLVDSKTGARLALKRQPATAAEPQGLWQAGKRSFATDELLGIVASEPERISPTALLRPVFQDFLFSSSAIIGGPAEIAYFAQSAVLYERLLGRMTPALPRFTATLAATEQEQLLTKHGLRIEELWGSNQQAVADLLAARAIPAEGRKRLDAAGQVLEAELEPLLAWMQSLEAGVGRSAQISASKMRYQMNRLKRLAANFVAARENSLGKEAATLSTQLAPGGALQERTLGAASFYARHGFALSGELVEAATRIPLGHAIVRL